MCSAGNCSKCPSLSLSCPASERLEQGLSFSPCHPSPHAPPLHPSLLHPSPLHPSPLHLSTLYPSPLHLSTLYPSTLHPSFFSAALLHRSPHTPPYPSPLHQSSLHPPLNPSPLPLSSFSSERNIPTLHPCQFCLVSGVLTPNCRCTFVAFIQR